MKIKMKLILGFVAVAFISGIVGLVGYRMIHQIENKFDEVVTEVLPVVETLEELQVRGLRVVASTNKLGLILLESQNATPQMKVDQQIEIELIQSEISHYHRALKDFEALAIRFTPEYDEFIKTVKGPGEDLMKTSEQMIQLKKQSISEENLLEIEKLLENKAKVFSELIERQLKKEKEESKRLHHDLLAEVHETMEFFISLSIIAFVTAIVLGLFIAQTLSAPIIQLTKAVTEVGKTKFETRVDIVSKDEVGVLARTFNQMAEDLSRTTVSKNYFASIVNSMKSSLIVLNPDGKIHEVNHATCYTLGYTEEELIGQSFENFIDQEAFFQEGVSNPTNQENQERRIDGGAAIGTLSQDHLSQERLPQDRLSDESQSSADLLSFLGFINNIEVFYLAKDGEKIPVLFSGAMMSDDDGEIRGYVCVAQNITELKRLEEQLKKAHEERS